jgi:iron complex transport system permease protein
MMLGIPNKAVGSLGTSLLVAVAASLAVGARSVAPDDVIAALLHPAGSTTDVVVREIRLPRTVIGFAVGAALGAAGAVCQAVTRNPLAEPGLLGISAGAALGVVVGIAAFGVATIEGWLWFGVVGAALATAAAVTLAGTHAGRDPVRLTLAGLALTTLAGALTSAIVLRDRAVLEQFRFWAAGSLAGRDLSLLVPALPVLATGAALAVAVTPALGSLALGDDVARSLGVPVLRARIGGAVAVALLAGAATTLCGPIAFVGLAVPHVARRWSGGDERATLVVAALLGAVALLFADVIGRIVARPAEIQAGLVAAVLGGPAFALAAHRILRVSA